MAQKETAGVLVVKLVSDTTQYEAALQGLKKTLGQIAGLTTTALAVKAFAKFSWGAMNAAADAVEVKNLFEVVFGGIRLEAEKMAEDLSRDFNIAVSSAHELLGMTGDLLTGFGFARKKTLEMSNEVARLAGDLASLRNIEGGAAEAAAKLTSAMIGNSRAARSLGIAFYQSDPAFQKAIKNLMQMEGYTIQQAKAQVILDIAVEQSKNAIGDYTETQETFANRQRKLGQDWKNFKEGIGGSAEEFFRAANGMNILGDSLKELGDSLKVSIGEGFFSIFGIEVRDSLKKVWYMVRFVFNSISTVIASSVNQWYTLIQWFAENFVNVMTGDFKGIKESWIKLTDEFKNNLAFDDLYGDWEKLTTSWKDASKKTADAVTKDNEEVAKKLFATWNDSKDKVRNAEQVKRGEYAKTAKLVTMSSENIRSAMQKAVYGNTEPSSMGSPIGNSIKNTTSAISAIGGGTGGIGGNKTTSIPLLITETNTILSTIRDILNTPQAVVG